MKWAPEFKAALGSTPHTCTGSARAPGHSWRCRHTSWCDSHSKESFLRDTPKPASTHLQETLSKRVWSAGRAGHRYHPGPSHGDRLWKCEKFRCCSQCRHEEEAAGCPCLPTRTPTPGGDHSLSTNTWVQVRTLVVP